MTGLVSAGQAVVGRTPTGEAASGALVDASRTCDSTVRPLDDCAQQPVLSVLSLANDCQTNADDIRPAAPFTFTRDGLTFICCWHEGHDPKHPANIGASHGCCDTCLAKAMAAERDYAQARRAIA